MEILQSSVVQAVSIAAKTSRRERPAALHAFGAPEKVHPRLASHYSVSLAVPLLGLEEELGMCQKALGAFSSTARTHTSSASCMGPAYSKERLDTLPSYGYGAGHSRR